LLWTAVDHFKPGILGWALGDHSAKKFEPLWDKVNAWKCYFYVTDGWSVYPMFIPDGNQIVSKTLCYYKCEEMLKHSIKLLIHYLKFDDIPMTGAFIP